MQDYNTIIGAIQMRLNKCPTRSVIVLYLLYCMGVDGYKKEYTLLHKATVRLLPKRGARFFFYIH